jgi:hypothetical protein
MSSSKILLQARSFSGVVGFLRHRVGCKCSRACSSSSEKVPASITTGMVGSVANRRSSC